LAKTLTPEQVLDILAERMEKRANVLAQTRIVDYEIAVIELRRFAAMIREARKHLPSTE
jgi:hypothetical protein